MDLTKYKPFFGAIGLLAHSIGNLTLSGVSLDSVRAKFGGNVLQLVCTSFAGNSLKEISVTPSLTSLKFCHH